MLFGFVLLAVVPQPPTLANYLDGSGVTNALGTYNALSDAGKAVADDAWSQIVDQAPPEHLHAQTVWLINLIEEEESGWTNQSCCSTTDLYATARYSSALSAMWSSNEKLTAGMKVQDRWIYAWCRNCISVVASANLPDRKGTHRVLSYHTAERPWFPSRIHSANVTVD